MHCPWKDKFNAFAGRLCYNLMAYLNNRAKQVILAGPFFHNGFKTILPGGTFVVMEPNIYSWLS